MSDASTGEPIEGAGVSTLLQTTNERNLPIEGAGLSTLLRTTNPLMHIEVDGATGPDGMLLLGEFPNDVQLKLTITAPGYDDMIDIFDTSDEDEQIVDIRLFKVIHILRFHNSNKNTAFLHRQTNSSNMVFANLLRCKSIRSIQDMNSLI